MLGIKVELLDSINPLDLVNICDAAEATMKDSNSFSIGLIQNQHLLRHELESYFKGVILIPERKLIVGRLDGTIAGSLQLITPSPSNTTSGFAVHIDTHFVAPWARNLGLSKKLLNFAEKYSLSRGYKIIRLNVSSKSDAAISLYENCGYKKWGVLDKYELVGNKIVSGFFYCKELEIIKEENKHESL